MANIIVFMFNYSDFCLAKIESDQPGCTLLGTARNSHPKTQFQSVQLFFVGLRFRQGISSMDRHYHPVQQSRQNQSHVNSCVTTTVGSQGMRIVCITWQASPLPRPLAHTL